MKYFSKKHKFIRYIKERFFLRFHMSLIITATALSGLPATTVLLLLNVKEMLVRYPLAVIFSYLVFFVLIVYSAPAILSEAAFEALVATSLIKATKRIDDPDWMGGFHRPVSYYPCIGSITGRDN